MNKTQSDVLNEDNGKYTKTLIINNIKISRIIQCVWVLFAWEWWILILGIGIQAYIYYRIGKRFRKLKKNHIQNEMADSFYPDDEEITPNNPVPSSTTIEMGNVSDVITENEHVCDNEVNVSIEEKEGEEEENDENKEEEIRNDHETKMTVGSTKNIVPTMKFSDFIRSRN